VLDPLGWLAAEQKILIGSNTGQHGERSIFHICQSRSEFR
jgi:hypothetical protein